MNPFDLTPGAEYFCRPFSAPPTTKPASVKGLVDSFGVTTHLNEGDGRFELYRLALLSSVERWLVYSVNHYRRALEMLTPISAPWAHVTLYYSSFFSANAILGMFGCWVKTEGTKVLIDVVAQTAGAQQLLITKKPPVPMPAVGSHGAFWAYFYDAAPKIAAWAPLPLKAALTPPTSHAWQPTTRNAVNYDMFFAFEASRHFKGSFDAAAFPASVTGDLGQQLETTQSMLLLASTFARDLSVDCFALNGLTGANGRLRTQRRLVRMASPKVTKHSLLGTFLAV